LSVAVTSAAAHERLYRARTVPALVEVPPARFLAADGAGRPGDEAFQGAVGALFALGYGARFALKRATGAAVKVPPLEGLYDTPENGRFTWTLMLRLPEAIDETLLDGATEAARKRDLPELERVEVRRLAEGRCAQILHIGPYAAEGPTIELLHAFIHGQGLEPRGRHHEIYLGDPRRARPDRLRTILRRPVG
jgi:hypothetical protein